MTRSHRTRLERLESVRLDNGPAWGIAVRETCTRSLVELGHRLGVFAHRSSDSPLSPDEWAAAAVAYQRELLNRPSIAQ